MPAPFATPVAFSTPFESEPERNNDFVSKNVQEAIEETLVKAVQNDRYAAFPSLSGNANMGKFLEFFPGASSDDVPFLIPVDSFLRAVTLVSSAVNTGNLGIYKNGNTANGQEIAIITFINQKTGFFTFDLSGPSEVRLDANDFLHVKVIDGNFNKPSMVTFLSTISGGL